MVSDDTFDRWVEEAVESLPPFFKDRIDNVLFVVEDAPDPELERDLEHPQHLLGLFQGIPITERSVWVDGPMYPNVITLYKDNIEAVSRDEAEIGRQIQETVFHELGHYFGLDEDQMDAIEEEWLNRP